MSRDDYFVNSERARSFPWRLYHGPIEDDLQDFLSRVAESRPGASLLVIGCGLLHERDRVPPAFRVTAVDIDPRAVQAVRDLADPRVVRTEVVGSEEDLSRLGIFDAAYAKEVIEHVVPWRSYLNGLFRALAPGGSLWLSTPNYGEPWLPAIESTALELVARLSGYSRRNLHPTRFSKQSLRDALVGAGFADVSSRTLAWRLALSVRGTRPPGPP